MSDADAQSERAEPGERTVSLILIGEWAFHRRFPRSGRSLTSPFRR